MPDYGWPKAEDRSLIGKRISRVDAPMKVSGQAKYTYDTTYAGQSATSNNVTSVQPDTKIKHATVRYVTSSSDPTSVTRPCTTAIVDGNMFAGNPLALRNCQLAWPMPRLYRFRL